MMTSGTCLRGNLQSILSLDQSIVDNEQDQSLFFCDEAGDEEVVELDT